MDQLFGDEIDEEGKPTLQLKSEEEYKSYGQKVGKVVFNGSAHYRVPLFYQEVSKELTENRDSRQIKKIADHLLSLYNEKLKKEKEDQKGKQKKKKAEKASLKGGGAKGYERNNNSAMINDVMGQEDQYGDEYGEYGDYGDEQAYTREQEKDRRKIPQRPKDETQVVQLGPLHATDNHPLVAAFALENFEHAADFAKAHPGGGGGMDLRTGRSL